MTALRRSVLFSFMGRYAGIVIGMGTTMVGARLFTPAVAAPAAPVVTPGAIIILGAEASNGPDGPDVGPLTLERLRRGAALQRKTGLPLLVTGGRPQPLADVMRASLLEDFVVPVQWEEPAAWNTGDNFRFATAILGQAGISAAYLVTHARHMRRAQLEAAGASLPVLPAAAAPSRRQADRLAAPRRLPRQELASIARVEGLR